MIIYTFLFLLLVYCAYVVDYKEDRKNWRFLYFLEWLFLVLVVGLQWRMGGDNIYYERMYEEIPPLSQLSGYEFIIGGKRGPLWILFCSAIKSFSSNYVLFHIVHSVVINTVVLYFFKRFTKYFFTATLLYFISFYYFFFNIDLQRESMAVMCFLLGVGHLEKKALIKYYVWAILAFLFHSSAVFCLVIPLLVLFSEKAKTMQSSIIRITLLTLIAAYALDQFYESTFVSDIVNNIAVQANNYHSVKINFSSVLIYSLFNIVPIVIVLFFHYRYPSQMNHTLVIISLMMVIVYVGYALNLSITRSITYLIFPYYVCVTNMMYIKNKRYGILAFVCILFLFVSRFYDLTIIHETEAGPMSIFNMYVPYRSIFD